MNKEQQRVSYFSGFENMTLQLSCNALQWLQGTTADNNGDTVSNASLFLNLLSQMRLSTGMNREFRRPQPLLAGHAQYSEQQLASRWNMGRKKVRNILDAMSRVGLIQTDRSVVASILSFPCVKGWNNAHNDKQREENVT